MISSGSSGNLSAMGSGTGLESKSQLVCAIVTDTAIITSLCVIITQSS